jgi:uncharacterized protein YkwD
VQFNNEQTGSNPTYQAPTGWSRPINSTKYNITWTQTTTNYEPGTYHYIAEMRVVGHKHVSTSPVLTFTLLLKPFDTGNPALNDSALTSELNNACTYPTNNPRGYISDSVPGCEAESLAALSAAQSQEGLTPWVAPANFWSLPLETQELDLVNGERIARNLPALSIDPSLYSCALTGAEAHTDPSCSSASYSQNAANWAEGPNTVYQDFLLMYDDGYSTSAGSGNLNCTAGNTSGCWGHRKNTLSPSYVQNTFAAACVSSVLTGGSPGFTYLPNLSCGEVFD